MIEYGVNEVVAALRTEHMSPYLLSLAIQARAWAPAYCCCSIRAGLPAVRLFFPRLLSV